jgi:uncharacterized membrane protein YcaP (DUF421 family)
MGIVLRAALMYLFILVVLRITTRRMMRSATPLDMAIVFLIGGMGIQPVLGEDRSIVGAMLAISTIAGLHIGLSYLRLLAPVVGRIAEGTAVVLYSNGAWDAAEMRRLRVQRQDVMAEMRQKGLVSLDDVQSVIIEHNGAISIIRNR